MAEEKNTNILGTELKPCSHDPLTGYFRDGYCRTGVSDLGAHVVCALVTKEFLDFTMEQGNDLKTPRPELNFAGLKEGDNWCLCALRWKEAYNFGIALPIIAESTNIKALEIIDIEDLQKHYIKRKDDK